MKADVNLDDEYWSTPAEGEADYWSTPANAQSQGMSGNNQAPGWFMQMIDKINQAGDVWGAPVAAGAIENAMFLPTLVGNVGRNIIGKESVPYANLEPYLKPEASKFAYNAAKFGPAAIGAAKLGAQGLGQLANQENLLGALVRGFSNKKTGQSVVNKFQENLGKSKEGFGSVFSEAEQAGLKNIPFDINVKDQRILKRAIGEPALDKYLSNPTPENLHFLRSNLQSWARDIEKLGGSAHPSDKAMLGTVNKYIGQTKNLLKNELEGLSPELLQKYLTSQRFHKENVVPFQSVGGRFVERAAQKPGTEGYLSASRVPGKIYSESGDSLRASKIFNELPEVKANRTLKIGGKAIVGTTGSLYLLKKLLSEHE